MAFETNIRLVFSVVFALCWLCVLLVTMPTQERAKLLAAFKSDPTLTYTDGTKAANVSHKTSKRWIDQFRSGDLNIADAARSGRPRKLTAKPRKALRQHVAKCRGATGKSATKIANRNMGEGGSVSESTVRRAMREHFEFKRVQHSAVSERNAEKRKLATTPAKINAIKKVIRSTVFTDASYVRFAPGKHIKAHRYEKAWSERGQTSRPPDNTRYTLVCFYGAIILLEDGTVECSPLLWAPPTPDTASSLNSQFYQSKVLAPLQQWAADTLTVPRLHWVQDNAKPHIAKDTKDWIAKKGMLMLDHVPQSPDTNPIEKTWETLKERAQQHAPRTWPAFYKTMQKEWREAVRVRGRSAILELPAVMKQIHAHPGVHVKNVPR